MNISGNNKDTTTKAVGSIPGTSMSDSCKNSASKLSDDDVNNMFKNMSADDNDIVSVCANCGKEGAKNICNKCKVTTYCNAVCKKVHKKKHKKDCDEHVRLAADKHNEELRIAAELHDEKLFRQPPPADDCPICFLRLPTLDSGWRYQTCCGKVICSGCFHAPVFDNQGNKVDSNKCPFCRTPTPTSHKEAMERMAKRVELNDAMAMYIQGNYYRDGMNGYPQDHTTALELWHRAAELGYTPTYLNIGYAHDYGEGVEVDKEKTKHYFELAAMLGHAGARNNQGNIELNAGNVDRALKHYMIAVRSGYAKSLKQIQNLYTNRHATKEVYTTALQSYQEYLVEIKSPQRDKAAAADDQYRYY